MENKDWKPEVGKRAWYMTGSYCREVSVQSINSYSSTLDTEDAHIIGAQVSNLYPTPEAALASIKFYDLQGNEVVPYRDLPVPLTPGENLMLYGESDYEGARRFIDEQKINSYLNDRKGRM